jgi:lipopolysaccharide export system protein LptA
VKDRPRLSTLTWLPLAGLVVVMLAAGILRAQQQSGVIKNFSAAPEFYPPPHQTQMKSLLQGAEAELHPSGAVTVRELKLQTFRPDGQRELLVEAPQCVYEPRQHLAHSPGKLKVQSGDGQLSIEGEGFLWRQTNSSLIISNQVHTSVQADVLNQQPSPRTNLVAPRMAGVDIDADRFSYETGPGVGLYQGHVRVTGTNLALRSESLEILVPMVDRQLQSISAQDNVEIQYEGVQATGQRVQYDALSDQLRMSGNPRWQAGPRSGSADELLIDRTNGFFRATGDANLRLAGQKAGTINFVPKERQTNPSSALATATNQTVTIHCQSYEVRTNSAVFREAVDVRQQAPNQPEGKMNCELLTVSFAGTNELQSMLAEKQVVIQQADNWFRADQAAYDGTNRLLELTGQPAWRAGLREGKGDVIRLDVAQSEMNVVGHASMRMPANDLVSATAVGGKTNRLDLNQPGTNFGTVYAERYTLSPEAAIFDGMVRVELPQMTWGAGIIVVRFPNPENQGGSMVAERGVAFELAGEGGARVRGKSEKAVYSSDITGNITNRLIQLTGQPVLETTNGRIENKVIILDLVSQRLIAPGKFKMRGFADASMTNTFRLPRPFP